MMNRSLFGMASAVEPTPLASENDCDFGHLDPIPLEGHSNDSAISNESSRQNIVDWLEIVTEIFGNTETTDLSDDINMPSPTSFSPAGSWDTHDFMDSCSTWNSNTEPMKSLKTDSFSLRPQPVERLDHLQEFDLRDDSTQQYAVAPPIAPHGGGKWHDRFQELCEFQKEHGHTCVPSDWPSNPPLPQWVKRQRYQHKLFKKGNEHSTLTAARVKTLNELNFVWDSHASFWEERLDELGAFREKHGHSKVPTKYPKNPQLAIWTKCQRRQHKLFYSEGANKSSMTLERMAKLAKLGFVFSPREQNKRKRKLKSSKRPVIQLV